VVGAVETVATAQTALAELCHIAMLLIPTLSDPFYQVHGASDCYERKQCGGRQSSSHGRVELSVFLVILNLGVVNGVGGFNVSFEGPMRARKI
jgi:hypothetical protein